jgi:hypothetical protein
MIDVMANNEDREEEGLLIWRSLSVKKGQMQIIVLEIAEYSSNSIIIYFISV